MRFRAEKECGGDVALPHLSLASLPLLAPGSHLFPLPHCHYYVGCLLSRHQQELQTFQHIYLLLIPTSWVHSAHLLAPPWLWPYHLFAQGKAASFQCAGDEYPRGIWPTVYETCWILLAGSLSCPMGKLCLNQVQEVFKTLPTCH